MIEFENVSKHYGTDSAPAVDNVSFHVETGSLNVILGESGSGKTTTLKLINRLAEATSGRIAVDGRNITALDPIELRRQIGYAFQGIGLFPHMSVAQNIGIVPELLNWPAPDIAHRTNELLELIGLAPAEYAERAPGELSGGQRQRVGVARALAARPRVLLMDEPFGALDPITRDELQSEFRTLQQQLEVTVVLVTHDVTEALLLADQIAVMKDGALLAHDSPTALMSTSDNEYVQQLMQMPKRQADRVAAMTH